MSKIYITGNNQSEIKELIETDCKREDFEWCKRARNADIALFCCDENEKFETWIEIGRTLNKPRFISAVISPPKKITSIRNIDKNQIVQIIQDWIKADYPLTTTQFLEKIAKKDEPLTIIPAYDEIVEKKRSLIKKNHYEYYIEAERAYYELIEFIERRFIWGDPDILCKEIEEVWDNELNDHINAKNILVKLYKD